MGLSGLPDILGRAPLDPPSTDAQDASRTLHDAPGRLQHPRPLRIRRPDVSGRLQDVPGRPRTLKHYACSVFWDGKGLGCWQQVARRTPPRLIFAPSFHYLMNSHSENLFSVSYILHIFTYSYVLSILITEYIQTDWFGFIHKTVYTPRGTRPRRIMVLPAFFRSFSRR